MLLTLIRPVMSQLALEASARTSGSPLSFYRRAGSARTAAPARTEHAIEILAGEVPGEEAIHIALKM
jgi:hypothetical protein